MLQYNRFFESSSLVFLDRNLNCQKKHISKYKRAIGKVEIAKFAEQGVIKKMSRCVLIVDDEEDVRTIAKLGLEMSTDWIIITVSSGQEALKAAISYQPDIILLDLMMPEWDGRITLKKLKENPTTQEIPVILMTAKTNSTDRNNFNNLDVVGIITKPFRPLKLEEKIVEVLKKKVT